MQNAFVVVEEVTKKSVVPLGFIPLTGRFHHTFSQVFSVVSSLFLFALRATSLPGSLCIAVCKESEQSASEKTMRAYTKMQAQFNTLYCNVEQFAFVRP